MSNFSRLAVFALISANDTKVIRFEQYHLANLTKNTIALNFPVHVTLKGRFSSSENSIKEVLSTVFLDYFNQLIPSQTIIKFSSPRYIKPQLSWVEVLSGNEGFELLINLHQILESETKKFIVEDEVSEAHKNSKFLPHITLGWGVTPQIWQEYLANRVFSLQQAQISHIALVRYSKNWPVNEFIDILLKIPLLS